MTQASSYRTILRSSSIMGAASVINILASLVKVKVVALLLGPAGVGLTGVYFNLIDAAATIAGLGVGSAGTRQIAAATADGEAAAGARVRRALLWITFGLSLIGSITFWLASDWIAGSILKEPDLAGDVAWLSIGVALTVATVSQGAVLTGFRRIGDLARIRVFSGVAGAALGVLILWQWGYNGLLATVLVVPVLTFVAGLWYLSRLERVDAPPTPLKALAAEWRFLVSLGSAFMLSALVSTLGHLAVRAIIQRELGADALGQFQAAWSIGMMYLGFVLGAMGTDYYPRLAASIKDHATAVRLVNEQTEVALLLCGPVLLAMLALAPWVIWLLYSAEFAPAADVLRWQLLGDILKVMSWPLGFVLVAAGAGKTYILTESSGIGVFIAAVAIGVPFAGVSATGFGFLALYVWYLPLVFVLARRRIGFHWMPVVIRQAIALIAAAAAVAGAAHVSPLLAAAFGLPAAAAFGIYGLARLGRMAGLGGRIGQLANMSQRVLNYTGVKL